MAHPPTQAQVQAQAQAQMHQQPMQPHAHQPRSQPHSHSQPNSQPQSHSHSPTSPSHCAAAAAPDDASSPSTPQHGRNRNHTDNYDYGGRDLGDFAEFGHYHPRRADDIDDDEPLGAGILANLPRRNHTISSGTQRGKTKRLPQHFEQPQPMPTAIAAAAAAAAAAAVASSPSTSTSSPPPGSLPFHPQQQREHPQQQQQQQQQQQHHTPHSSTAPLSPTRNSLKEIAGMENEHDEWERAILDERSSAADDLAALPSSSATSSSNANHPLSSSSAAIRRHQSLNHHLGKSIANRLAAAAAATPLPRSSARYASHSATASTSQHPPPPPPPQQQQQQQQPHLPGVASPSSPASTPSSFHHHHGHHGHHHHHHHHHTIGHASPSASAIASQLQSAFRASDEPQPHAPSHAPSHTPFAAALSSEASPVSPSSFSSAPWNNSSGNTATTHTRSATGAESPSRYAHTFQSSGDLLAKASSPPPAGAAVAAGTGAAAAPPSAPPPFHRINSHGNGADLMDIHASLQNLDLGSGNAPAPLNTALASRYQATAGEPTSDITPTTPSASKKLPSLITDLDGLARSAAAANAGGLAAGGPESEEIHYHTRGPELEERHHHHTRGPELEERHRHHTRGPELEERHHHHPRTSGHSRVQSTDGVMPFLDKRPSDNAASGNGPPPVGLADLFGPHTAAPASWAQKEEILGRRIDGRSGSAMHGDAAAFSPPSHRYDHHHLHHHHHHATPHRFPPVHNYNSSAPSRGAIPSQWGLGLSPAVERSRDQITIALSMALAEQQQKTAMLEAALRASGGFSPQQQQQQQQQQHYPGIAGTGRDPSSYPNSPPAPMLPEFGLGAAHQSPPPPHFHPRNHRDSSSTPNRSIDAGRFPAAVAGGPPFGLPQQHLPDDFVAPPHPHPPSHAPAPATDIPALIAQLNLNPVNFELSPPSATRFLVIKSFTEDDVHRSIRHGIWASTDKGNQRLDRVYKACQREAHERGEQGAAAVYLFFSVNGSGHFCGMAQMMSDVDFNTSSDVWAQEGKWKGTFAVKHIFVKDIPNRELRHIKLPNNPENKSVTQSRDTQELNREAGLEMLKIMYAYPAKTSLLTDMGFYDEEEKKLRGGGGSVQARQMAQVQQQHAHGHGHAHAVNANTYAHAHARAHAQAQTPPPATAAAPTAGMTGLGVSNMGISPGVAQVYPPHGTHGTHASSLPPGAAQPYRPHGSAPPLQYPRRPGGNGAGDGHGTGSGSGNGAGAGAPPRSRTSAGGGAQGGRGNEAEAEGGAGHAPPSAPAPAGRGPSPLPHAQQQQQQQVA